MYFNISSNVLSSSGRYACGFFTNDGADSWSLRASGGRSDPCRISCHSFISAAVSCVLKRGGGYEWWGGQKIDYKMDKDVS